MYSRRLTWWININSFLVNEEKYPSSVANPMRSSEACVSRWFSDVRGFVNTGFLFARFKDFFLYISSFGSFCRIESNKRRQLNAFEITSWTLSSVENLCYRSYHLNSIKTNSDWPNSCFAIDIRTGTGRKNLTVVSCVQRSLCLLVDGRKKEDSALL